MIYTVLFVAGLVAYLLGVVVLVLNVDRRGGYSFHSPVVPTWHWLLALALMATGLAGLLLSSPGVNQ